MVRQFNQQPAETEVRVPECWPNFVAPSKITTTTITELPIRTTEEKNSATISSAGSRGASKMSRTSIGRQPIYCCCRTAILLVICLLHLNLQSLQGNTGIVECSGSSVEEFVRQTVAGGGGGGSLLELKDETKTGRMGGSSQSGDDSIYPESLADLQPTRRVVARHNGATNQVEVGAKLESHQMAPEEKDGRSRFRRSPLLVAASMPTSYLVPINELRISGSKSEPPSRPSVDWSKQRPHFGPDMVRNVSVELGKTAYLTCKVFELGDKTVSWLRPSKNEILTSGRFTYIGDSRFASINDKGSHDWILEIKDVGLNDSTSYECQVSTDPKMSAIINLQVKAAKAKIKQGEQFYAPLGSSIEFTCEIGQKASSSSAAAAYLPSLSVSSLPSNNGGGLQQTYWYYNGNLLNYAKTAPNLLEKNFSIEWDSMTQTSRFRLFNIQLNDAGNYTCKPTSAEPATIRLHVKRFNKNNLKDRTHYGNGYHSANTKEAQKNRQYFSLENGSGLEMVADSAAVAWSKALLPAGILTQIIISCLLALLLLAR